MRIHQTALLTLAVGAFVPVQAEAQHVGTVEVTPYAALGTPRTSPVGVVVSFPVSSALSVETDVAYRRAEGDMNALSTNANLVWSLPRAGLAMPFVSGGIGLSQYGTPLISSAGSPIGTDSRLAFTVNAGGGMKMPVNNRVSLRTDARWFKSFGKYGSEHVRVAQGVSLNVGRR